MDNQIQYCYEQKIELRTGYKMKILSKTSFYSLVAAGIIGFSPAGHAQAYRRIAPQPLPVQPPVKVSVPTAKSGIPSSRKVILRHISGIVVTDPGHLDKNGILPAATGPSRVLVEHAPHGDAALAKALQPYVGKTMSFDRLRMITNTVIEWYRRHGRPFVDVTVPPQNINSGVIQVSVLEYRLGKVTVTGNHWFSKTAIKNAVGLKPGQTMTTAGLQADLDWANKNAFRTVNAVFSPGATPGTTNVDLKTKDSFPVRFYAGYDNEGVPSLGVNEWDLGFNWGNAFDLGQTLSFQMTRSFNGRYRADSISDTIPLPWRDQILIFGSYEQEQPNLGIFFRDAGHSGQASIRYVHKVNAINGDVQIGYDFKTTNSNLEFGGYRIFNSTAEIDQFPVIVEGNEYDRWGSTSIRNKFVISPGGLQYGNTNNAFGALVPYAKARYVYDRLSLTRIDPLPHGFSLVTRATLQDASSNLLDSEELAGGGPGSVVGYRSSTALGSKGVLAAVELRTPAFHPRGLFGLKQGTFQADAFWNYADLHQIRDVPNTPKVVDLASIGVGLNYQYASNIDAKFAVGWQLRNAPGFIKKGGFGEFSITIGF